MLLLYRNLGENRQVNRFWLESHRIAQLGFSPQSFLQVKPLPDGVGLVADVVPEKTRNRVSHKVIGGLPCPVIDLNHKQILAHFERFEEIKVRVAHKKLLVSPTNRAFHIRKLKAGGFPLPTVEFCCGGGTLSECIERDPRFKLVAGVEIDDRYASAWAARHPDTPLIQGDMRKVESADLPRIGVLVASLPCTCFSTAGIAKKGLKGISELGDTGDLYLHFLSLVRESNPLCLVVENVNGFFTSLAGQSLIDALKKIGYKTNVIDLNPSDEWGEPQDRKRSVLVATLFGTFYPTIPMQAFTGTLNEYLDAPNQEQDQADALRIANSIQGRRAHMERHAALGHGFGFTVIDRNSKKCPTLLRSYWKINTGPFVQTPYGLRLLRQAEMARLMGAEERKELNYKTAVQVMGQGVQGRIFTELFKQLGDFLLWHVKP